MAASVHTRLKYMELLAVAVVKEENRKTGEQQQKRCKITTNSRLEVILIACQRNRFCKHKILESCCTREFFPYCSQSSQKL